MKRELNRYISKEVAGIYYWEQLGKFELCER